MNDFDTKKFLFSFEGRIPRIEYWVYWTLPYLVLNTVFLIIDFALGLYDEEIGFGLLSGLFMLVAIWPTFAVNIKRWHDRDKSGWWMLILLIPFLGAFWALIELGFLKGTEGTNRFGLDPLGESGDEARSTPEEN